MVDNQTQGLVHLGSILESAVKELYKEGPQKVLEKVTKAPYHSYVSIAYTKTAGGFTLQGQVQVIEVKGEEPVE